MAGKGDARRKEDAKAVNDNLAKVDWSKHKPTTTFKTTYNGKDKSKAKGSSL